jgi:hypothetical protein
VDVVGYTTGEGYSASLHLAVETACQGALGVLPESAGLPDSSTGRELLALCEDFGKELVTTMQLLGRRVTGDRASGPVAECMYGPGR